MRITGWHVDGYGRFHDDAWRDLPSGLTVFHGPNEAGKSTLLSFLHTVLFGFPRANAVRPAIEPLHGGAHGGRVFLRDDADADWTIQRLRGPGGLTVRGPGGEGDDDDLQRLLGHVSRDVFQSVFAFSLQELEALGGLDDEAVRRRLFAAGLTGVGRSTDDALDELTRRADRLYRQRRSSILGGHHERLEALRSARSTAIARLDEHAGLQRQEAEHHEAVGAAEAALDALVTEDRRLDRLQRLWQVVAPLYDAEEELSRLGGGPAVPADAVADVRALDEALAGIREQLTERRGAVALRAEARGRSTIDDRLIGAAAAARELAGRVPVQRDRLAEHRGLVAERERTGDAAAAARSQLGPGWDGERVLRFDGSVEVRAQAAEWVTGLSAEDERIRTADDEERRLSDAARVAREEASVARAALDASDVPPSVDELDRDAEALGRVRVLLDEALRSRRDAATEETNLAALEAVAPQRDRTSSAVAGRVPIMLVVAVLAIVLGVVLVGAGQPLGGTAVLVVGIAVGAIHRSQVRAAAAAARDAGAAEDAVGRHAERVDQQRARAERAKTSQDAADEALWTAAAGARLDGGRAGSVSGRQGRGKQVGDGEGGNPGDVVTRVDDAAKDPDFGAIEARVRAVERAREARRAHDLLADAAADAEERAATAEATLARAVDDAERVRPEAERVRARWRAWVAERGLPEDLDVSAVQPVLDAVALARATAHAWDAAAAKADESARRITAWAERAGALLASVGRGGVSPAAVGRGVVSPATAAAGHDGLPSTSAGQGVGGAAPGDGSGATPVLGATVPDAEDVDAHERLLDAVVWLDADATAATQVGREHERSRVADETDLEAIERLDRRREHGEAERSALLARYGAVDLDQLRAADEASRRREALAATVAHRRDEVRRLAGRGPDADVATREARTGDVSAWEARRGAIAEESAARKGELTTAIESRTQARDRREALERDADLPRLDAEIEQVRADAAAALVEYRVVLRAQDLIRDTLATFVRDRQPEVLRDASRWFERITDGRYVGVRQSADDGRRGAGRQPLRVDDAAGRELDPTALSRGTRELLYLCLRLALARSTARKGTPLPLVMDDVLVNFSPDRAAAIAEVLVEVAAEQQLLFFTCHPATRDLLTGAGAADGRPTPRIEELARAGV